MKDARDQFIKEYGRSPEITLEIPGIAALIGVFSEVYQGSSIMFATDDGIVVSGSLNSDNSVRILNIARQEKKRFSILNIKYRKEDRWANIIKSVYSAFQKRGYKLRGTDIVLDGKALLSDNKTLSAILCAAISSLINRLFSLSLDNSELLEIVFSSSLLPVGYRARKRDLNALLLMPPGAVMLYDQSTSLSEFAPLSFLNDKRYEFFLFSSTMPPTIISSVYEEVEKEAAEAFEDLVLGSLDEAKFRAMNHRELLSLIAPIRSRKRDVVLFLHREHELSLRLWDAIKSENIDEFSALLMEYQHELSEEAEITSPEIDWLFKRAISDENVLMLSSLYTGYGGDMVALIIKGHNTPYMERLDEFERIFGFRIQLRGFSVSNGIRVIAQDENSTGK